MKPVPRKKKTLLGSSKLELKFHSILVQDFSHIDICLLPLLLVLCGLQFYIILTFLFLI